MNVTGVQMCALPISQQVADQKDGVVSKSVGKFFDAFTDFAIFEIAQTAIELSHFIASIIHQMPNLFRSETNSPEHALISLVREGFVKDAQAIRILETVERLPRA